MPGVVAATTWLDRPANANWGYVVFFFLWGLAFGLMVAWTLWKESGSDFRRRHSDDSPDWGWILGEAVLPSFMLSPLIAGICVAVIYGVTKLVMLLA